MEISITINNPTENVMLALANFATGHGEPAIATATVVAPVATVPEARTSNGQAPESTAEATQASTEKPKRQRRSNNQQETQPAPGPEAQEEEPVQEEPAAEADPVAPEVPTVVELRAKVQEVATTPESKKSIKALLDKFGAKSISDIPEEKRADFMAELDLV